MHTIYIYIYIYIYYSQNSALHKLTLSQASATGWQDPRRWPFRGWPHARHHGVALAWLPVWNSPLPYVSPTTDLKAFTRARRPLRCCFLFSFTSLRPFGIDPSNRLSSSVLSSPEHGGGRPAACRQPPVCLCYRRGCQYRWRAGLRLGSFLKEYKDVC